MRVKDVMATEVVTLKPEASIREAAKLFVELHISGAPVVDARGEVVGMISEGDLLHRQELDTDAPRRSHWLSFFFSASEAADYVKSHARAIGDVMSRNVISVDENTPLQDVANLFESRRIKRVPVLRDGKLVGIVSRANLVQALASAPEEEASESTLSDADIRATLMGEITGRKWSYIGRNVIVRDGVVHLWGSVWSADEIRAARVAAESIPGVKRVEEHVETQAIITGY
jgi:CBS domain-containing protein